MSLNFILFNILVHGVSSACELFYSGLHRIHVDILPRKINLSVENRMKGYKRGNMGKGSSGGREGCGERR